MYARVGLRVVVPVCRYRLRHVVPPAARERLGLGGQLQRRRPAGSGWGPGSAEGVRLSVRARASAIRCDGGAGGRRSTWASGFGTPARRPSTSDWPVEVSLLNPASREIVWKDTFEDVDIRSWLPGNQWNSKTKRYDTETVTYDISSFFVMPDNLPGDDYVLALAILDPAGMVPSVRFAIENYFIGGRHPIGLVGVGKKPSSTELDPASFDDPSQDRTLHYELAPSADASRDN